jgi:hypothetical protein
MRPNRSAPVRALLLAGLAVPGCSRPDYATAPVAGASVAGASAAPSASAAPPQAGGSPRRFACRTDEARTARGVIGPEGGELRVAGFGVAFPAGAVPARETFELTVVPGDYVELQAHAVGHARYAFAAPVAVTLDLAGCGRLPSGLRAYHIADGTRALLEDMGGVVDPARRTLRFATPHFSGFTVVWGSEPAPGDSAAGPPETAPSAAAATAGG